MEYFIKKLRENINLVRKRAKQNRKISMFSIATTANINNKEVTFPSVRETEKTICGNILLNSNRHLKKVVKEIDGLFEVILVDAETKIPNMVDLEFKVRQLVKKSKVLTFKPNDTAVDSADALIAQLKSPLKNRKITIIGAGNIGSKLALKLVERGANVYLTRRKKRRLKKIVDGLNAIKSSYLKSKVHYVSDNLEATKDADVLIGATAGIAVITSDMVRNTKANCLLIDIGNGTIFPEAVIEAAKRNVRIICVSMKPGYAGTIEAICQTERFLRNQKSKNLGNFSMISSGIFGRRGDVIVDDVDNPRELLSIADGNGDVIPYTYDKKFKENVDIVRQLIGGRSK